LIRATARAEVQNALNAGQLLVNYLGHGSIEVWSGDGLLDDTSAAALTNGFEAAGIPHFRLPERILPRRLHAESVGNIAFSIVRAERWP